MRSNRRVPLKTDAGPLYTTAALLLLSASASAEVRVEGAASVEACMAAAGGAGYGEPTVCTLASGVLRPSATPHLAPIAPLRGPVTVRGAASGEPTTLSGALPVPSHGWQLDPSAGGKPIFVTTLPEPLRTTQAGTAPVQVFVDDVFISGKPQRLWFPRRRLFRVVKSQAVAWGRRGALAERQPEQHAFAESLGVHERRIQPRDNRRQRDRPWFCGRQVRARGVGD